MSQLPIISEAEYEVMKVIWDNAPVSTNTVVELLTQTTKWTPKTIQSLLGRLVKKGALDYEKQSRVFIYTPIVKKGEYVKEESNTFLNRFYNGTLNKMVVNFLEEDRLTKDDIEDLKRILDEKLLEGDR